MTGVALDALSHLGQLHGDGAVRLRGVQHDSRCVGPGDLFVAIAGQSHDGAAFARSAVDRGATALLTERALDLGVPQLVVDDARAALGPAASTVYGHPTRQLDVVGITGTNGKTTIAWLLESIVGGAGHVPALMGTVGTRGPAGSASAAHTTPEGDDVARFARAAVDVGATHLLMEVSSHGLALHRVDGVRFKVAVFSNLTRDHLDFHGTFEAYGAAKRRLFVDLDPGHCVVNVDDAFGAELAGLVVGPCTRCSAQADPGADVRVMSHRLDRDGIVAQIATPAGEAELRSPLIGGHNLENLVLTVGAGLALGHELAAVVRALEDAAGAPGRLERVPDARGVAVLVDYAHTPDALERALAALRPITSGRLMVVFGCGGDRDREKRPHMGSAAERGADLCVVTSDNPRTESPGAILSAIVAGMDASAALEPSAFGDARAGHAVVEDRAQAIELAIHGARRDDTVLIAGKGHEDYQIVGTEKRPFDDREQARRAIASAGGRP